MPEVKKIPDALRPYLSLGLPLEWREDREQAECQCPWCGREGGKFSMSVKTGLWQCKVCGTGNEHGGGNDTLFLRLLWERSDKETSEYGDLQANRKLMEPDTLLHWGACKSFLTGEWLVPGFNQERKLVTLYRWEHSWRSGKHVLKVADGLGHGLFLPLGFFDPAADEVFVCEGIWDGMALWELDRSRCVMAIPGCNVFKPSWLPLFAGKTANLLFHNDHPREVNGAVVDGAGLAGVKRAAGMLITAKEPVKEVRFLKWGEAGWEPRLNSGYDVRDWVVQDA